jgi:FAD/FMN-containing dehydrogenase
MNDIRVDPGARTVEVGGGATLGEVDRATHPFGLATVGGMISTTGVGGLTLGGGHGYLSRKYGLTIDNLISADVVLADGSFVTASKEQHAELFWALRGGGGNFGIVTSFKFRLHPMNTVMFGPTLWPLEQAEMVMRWYRDFLPSASRDLFGFFAFLTVPPGPPFPEELHLKKMCGIVWCYTGPAEKADEVFAPILEVGTPVLHGVQTIPYPAMQSAFDALYPPGFQWYWKGDFVRTLPDEAVALHIKHGSELPTMFSTMHLYPIDGAVQDVGEHETAWSYRDVTWSAVIVGVDPDPSNNEKIRDWARDYWEALHPYSAGGAYSNFMMEEGEDRVRASYRDNYDRLARIKAKYDPANLFRVNQNIKPAA